MDNPVSTREPPTCPHCHGTNTEYLSDGGYQDADASRGLPMMETDGLAWCRTCEREWWD